MPAATVASRILSATVSRSLFTLLPFGRLVSSLLANYHAILHNILDLLAEGLYPALARRVVSESPHSEQLGSFIRLLAGGHPWLLKTPLSIDVVSQRNLLCMRFRVWFIQILSTKVGAGAVLRARRRRGHPPDGGTGGGQPIAPLHCGPEGAARAHHVLRRQRFARQHYSPVSTKHTDSGLRTHHPLPCQSNHDADHVSVKRWCFSVFFNCQEGEPAPPAALSVIPYYKSESLLPQGLKGWANQPKRVRRYSQARLHYTTTLPNAKINK
eukprot:1182410-Prorocentrum_minimum.AAC.4